MKYITINVHFIHKMKQEVPPHGEVNPAGENHDGDA